jgi:MFS family permease
VEPIEPLSTESVQPEAAPAPPAPLLRNRNFFLLWIGQTVSQLGNQAYAIAMMFWLMERTGSATLMGGLMTASTLPGVFLGPFGGTFADRHSRIRTAIVCDLLAGLGIGVLAVALWRDQASRLPLQLLTGLFFAVAVLIGVIRSFFQPAIAAAIPDLVPKERLAAANSLNQFSIQGTVFVGQAAGGVLFGWLGAPLLFLVDALSYFFAAGAEALIPRDERRRAEAPSNVHPFRHFLHETAEGFRWVWAQRGMREFLFGVSLINFLAMPTTVLFPFYVKIYLNRGPQWYGFLLAAISVGAVVGFILAGTLRLSGAARARGVLTAMVLYPLCFGLLAFIRVPQLAVVALLAGGATVGFINVYLITLIQAGTPSEVRGRVMGLLGTLSGGLIPLGMALGGVVGDLTHKNVPLILLVSAGLGLLITLGMGASRTCREFLANG